MVHYVSYGTPGGEYGKECRAAIITEVSPESNAKGDHFVSLCVLNPTGQFFAQAIGHHDGAEQRGQADCTQRSVHGNPFRYCSCGWMEADLVGGTWHWPERTD